MGYCCFASVDIVEPVRGRLYEGMKRLWKSRPSRKDKTVSRIEAATTTALSSRSKGTDRMVWRGRQRDRASGGAADSDGEVFGRREGDAV
jgi:hypothetical protein